MSFPEWLKETHGKSWDDLFCFVSDTALIQYTQSYEEYCATENIKPRWVD